MDNFNLSSVEVESTHTIKMVASVSFDRNRKQFKYEGALASVFGKKRAEEMQARQGIATGYAQQKLGNAAGTQNEN